MKMASDKEKNEALDRLARRAQTPDVSQRHTAGAGTQGGYDAKTLEWYERYRGIRNYLLVAVFGVILTATLPMLASACSARLS